jgi:hypothetical protein
MLEFPQVGYESLLRSIKPYDAFGRQFFSGGIFE